MKTPPERLASKGPVSSPAPSRKHPILPTVFMRGPVLQEQLRLMRTGGLPNLSMEQVMGDVSKKSGELHSLLHSIRYSPSRSSPYTIQEAEMVLKQAECLLGAASGTPPKESPEASKERLCRAVDMVLMLDAAIRALQSP